MSIHFSSFSPKQSLSKLNTPTLDVAEIPIKTNLASGVALI